MTSMILPESSRVDYFTVFCKPNSLIISSSWLRLLAVLLSVMCCCLPQLLSGRLKSPAISTFGALMFFKVLKEICGGLQEFGDGNRGSVVGGKVNKIISCKIICPHVISPFEFRLASGSATMSSGKTNLKGVSVLSDGVIVLW